MACEARTALRPLLLAGLLVGTTAPDQALGHDGSPPELFAGAPPRVLYEGAPIDTTERRGAARLPDTTLVQESGQVAAPSAKRIETVAVVGAPLRVDGRLDDPAWREARFVSDFLQKEPDQGAPPSQPTEVAFLHDGEALYVGARMRVDDASAVDGLLTRRDDDANAERLIVALDTYHDRRTAYGFAVTAAGARLDWYHPEDDEATTDLTFNPVWTARTAIAGDGWTAEMRIPFSQLRFSGTGTQVWGVNVERIVPARNERDYWVYVPRDETGWASRFGELVGIEGVPPSRRLEVMPYVSGDARLTSRELVDEENPLDDGSEAGASVGADLKLGLGSSLTLDATLNPDFGQIEADPAQVNLSEFEVFFDEKRAFFTEGGRLLGAQLYADGQAGDPPPWFYSRRIGGPPHGAASADFVESPGNSTILGAAKLTGRLRSGLSVGGLAALTTAERARTFDLLSKETSEVEVEPRTAFGVVRLQQQFGPAASTAALMLTGVRRDLPEGSPLADLLARTAVTGGADWNLRFRGGTYDLKGHLGFSHVKGEREAIGRIQRSSAHHFQRPDQDHVRFDPDRTSMTGATGMLRFRKASGGHLRAEAGVWGDTPDLELNDLGRLGRADDIALWGNLRWREDTPRGWLRNWQVGAYGEQKRNFGGLRKFTRGMLRSEQTWSNFWESAVEVGLVPRWTSDDFSRGGPLMGMGHGWDVTVELRGNQQARTKWGGDAYTYGNEIGARGLFVNGELSTYAGSRLRLSVEPHVGAWRDIRQYLATLEGGGAETFGRRYVFARSERRELSAQLRASYSFTPDLSLELYAEPFTSSGRFDRFGELPRPRSRELRLYGTDGTTLARGDEGEVIVTDGASAFTLENPDFNIRSFRSNLLLRWEWQPGSTLYLVWQQNRSRFDATADRADPEDLLDSLTASGENVLALKITYWLPIG